MNYRKRITGDIDPVRFPVFHRLCFFLELRLQEFREFSVFFGFRVVNARFTRSVLFPRVCT